MTRLYSSNTPLCVQIVLFDGFDLLDAMGLSADSWGPTHH